MAPSSGKQALQMIIRNTLEELVIEEVRQRIDLQKDLKGDLLQMSEVIATALNLLPPLYACTERGWLQQRKRAHSKMMDQIATAVQLGIAQQKSNPLAYALPLSMKEIRRSGHCLLKTREILGKNDLTWIELPSVLEKKLAQKALEKQQEHSGLPASIRQRIPSTRKPTLPTAVETSLPHKFQGMHHALTRQKLSFDPQTLQDPKQSNPRYEEDLEFYSYMVTSPYSLANVLERVVIAEAYRRIKQMGKTLSPQIYLEDAVCYTLNRLHPMYVSHVAKYNRQARHLPKQLLQEIQQGVVESLMRLNGAPARIRTYLPLAKFERDFEQVLPEMQKILATDQQIKKANIVEEIEAALETPQSLNNRLSVMCNELCTILGIDAISAGISLSSPENGLILIDSQGVKTSWALADQPHLIAYVVLKHSPKTTAVTLSSSELESPLSFSHEHLLHQIEQLNL